MDIRPGHSWRTPLAAAVAVLVVGLIWSGDIKDRLWTPLYPGIESHQECLEVWDAVRAKFGDDVQFCVFSSGRRMCADVYGIGDDKGQDRLLEFLSAERSKHGWSPIQVRFLDHPVFHVGVTPGGQRVDYRGGEEVLRTEWVR